MLRPIVRLAGIDENAPVDTPDPVFSQDTEAYAGADVRRKVVYFVRHGQSQANIAHNSFDDALRDARLTELGVDQARRLQEVVDLWGVQAVFCSPLTRAIQTACLAFENTSVPITAWPIVTEFYPQLPECQGRNASDLKQALELSMLPRFKDVCLDGVYDQWWHIAGDRAGRIGEFLQWLAVTPHTRTAVVCHWGFIFELLSEEMASPVSLEIHNCTQVRAVFDIVSGPVVSPHAGKQVVPAVVASGYTSGDQTAKELFEQLLEFYTRCRHNKSLRNANCCSWGMPYVRLTTSPINCPSLTDLGQLKRTAAKAAAGYIQTEHEHFHFQQPMSVVEQSSERGALVQVRTKSESLADLCEKLSIVPPQRRAQFIINIVDATGDPSGYSATGPIPLGGFVEAADGLSHVQALLKPRQDQAATEVALKALAKLQWELCIAVEPGPSDPVGSTLHFEGTFPI